MGIFSVIPGWVYASAGAVVLLTLGLQHWRIGELRDEAVVLKQNLAGAKLAIERLQLETARSEAAQLKEILASGERNKRKALIHATINQSTDDGYAGSVVRDTVLELHRAAAAAGGGQGKTARKPAALRARAGTTAAHNGLAAQQ